MSWRDFKRDPAGFKGFKGFKLPGTPPLKPLRPLKPGEMVLKSPSLDSCRPDTAEYRTAAGDTAANSPAEWTAERPEFAGGETGEKQILLAFASPAGSEITANSHFAKSCKCLILGARHPGRRKILRPLSVYEYRLAAEAGRRAVFCENHRRELDGSCQHFEIIERLIPGDQAAALDGCLLWQRIRIGQGTEHEP